MDSMIHIGNIDKKKDTALDAASAIDKVFTSARENNMDQNTVVEALQVLSKISEIKNINIDNSIFTNNEPKDKEQKKSPIEDDQDTILEDANDTEEDDA